ncbi:hypothetical protein AU467_00230 [Mesorhizobium loti]|uniref:Uncharacterized protein n=1 Tax=Rhizobium loti TaxID=381 RepID=A0A101KXH0_RHILI|nr:hypothetical protein AU467_00230 [Mesorhizobium loti]
MDEPALDTDVAPQDISHARGEHEQASRHVRLADDRHALPLGPRLHRAHPAGHEAHVFGQFGSHRRDEVVVENAVVAGTRAVEHATLAHVDDLVEGAAAAERLSRRPIRRNLSIWSPAIFSTRNSRGKTGWRSISVTW